MSLPQLIGLKCVACQQGINSVTTAKFCDSCGNPIHRACVARTEPPPEEMCEICGGDPETSTAKEVRRERGGAEQVAASRQAPVKYPVSLVCPGCKSEQYTRERPLAWVAFAWDRVCTECGMRYSPPTPLWAAYVFLVVGLILTGFGIVGLVAADVCMAILGVLGILALYHGYRSLARPGKF